MGVLLPVHSKSKSTALGKELRFLRNAAKSWCMATLVMKGLNNFKTAVVIKVILVVWSNFNCSGFICLSQTAKRLGDLPINLIHWRFRTKKNHLVVLKSPNILN